MQEQYDINFNIGGPIWKQKAWFFYSYRLNDQYTYILGLGDQVQRSKLTNPYTFKGTFQLGRNNQLIGFFNKREKLQDKRDVEPDDPALGRLLPELAQLPDEGAVDQRPQQPRCSST